MPEFGISIPILALLVGGMILAALYSFRSAAADWGIFIYGVTAGAYDAPATDQARASMMWPDIRDRITAESADNRQVRSQIEIQDSNPWMFGIKLVEAQRGTAYFRLWRFYPGPDGDE